MLYAGLASKALGEWVGYRLPGHSARKNAAQCSIDRQYVRAIALQEGRRTFVILLADVIAMDELLVNQVQRHVSERIGVVEDDIIACATHTHTGPPVFDLGDARSVDGARTDVVRCAAEAAESAVKDIQRIDQIELVTAHNPYAVNRRLPVGDVVVMAPNFDGPVDDTLTMIVLRARESVVGRLLCLPMHPTVLSPAISALSGDVAGLIASELEGHDGGKAPSLVFQGASGDIRALVTDEAGEFTGGTSEKVQEIALKLVENLLFEKSSHKSLEPTLMAQAIPLKLETVQPETIAMPESYFRRVSAISLSRDIACVFLPGEPFAAIASAIRDCSPFEYTMVIGHAEATVGYVPTALEFERGGYEAEEAFAFYGLPAALARDAGPRMANRACELLRSLINSEERGN